MTNNTKKGPLGKEPEEIKPLPNAEPAAGQPLIVSAWKLSAAGVIELIFAIGVLALVWLLARPLALLILGVAIAAALSPMVARLERSMPRLLSIVLVYMAVLLILFGISLIIIPQLVNQAREISLRAPGLIREMQELIAHGDRMLGVSLLDVLLPQVGQISAGLVSLPIKIVSSLFDILLVLFILIYFLIEAPSLRGFIRSLYPPHRWERIDRFYNHISQAMGGYVRGAAITSAAVGFLTYLGLLVIGVDFPLVFGLLAGVLEIIPYLGPVLAAIPILIVALLDSPTKALAVLIFLFVLQQFESLILRPKIMQAQTAVSPLLVILAIIMGSVLGGLLGVIVAIPLVAGLRVVVNEVVAPEIRRRSGAGEGGSVEAPGGKDNPR